MVDGVEEQFGRQIGAKVGKKLRGCWMKVSLRALLIVVTLVAVFLGGWIGGSQYQRLKDEAERQAISAGKLRAISGGLRLSDLIDSIPSKVEGVVTKTHEDMVAISLGTDDGVRKGHEISIYRGTKYIGYGVVTRAEHNQSAVKMRSPVDIRPIREGDYATTKF